MVEGETFGFITHGRQTLKNYFSIDVNYTEENEIKITKILIDLIKNLYQEYKCTGSGYQVQYNAKNLPELPENLPFDYLSEPILIYKIWSVNLFSPNKVKKYGREKLLKAPCELIEELEDGAIFMMIHKDRFSSTYEERKKLRKYLGELNEK